MTRTGRIVELRMEIDRLNLEILRAVERRGELVLQILELKRLVGLPVYDPVREQEMLEALVASRSGPFDAEAVRSVFRTLFEVSRGLGQRTPAGTTT